MLTVVPFILGAADPEMMSLGPIVSYLLDDFRVIALAMLPLAVSVLVVRRAVLWLRSYMWS